ncbi:MAG TPA: DUF4231 domain-containing protein [Burkholderiales bacterium]|nr:DUF4231 domain-containing protein [Burkholderiales bacterium]
MGGDRVEGAKASVGGNRLELHLSEDESPSAGLADVFKLQASHRSRQLGTVSDTLDPAQYARDVATWYRSRAIRLRLVENVLRGVEFLIAATLPVLVAVAAPRWTYSVAAAAVFFSVSLQTLFRHRDTDVLRRTALAIEQELRMYIAAAGPYGFHALESGRRREAQDAELALRVARLVEDNADARWQRI